MKEKDFQAQVIRIAKAFGWTWFHPYDSRKSTPGFPDLVLVRERILYRELKTDNKRSKLTAHQKAWGEKLTHAGGDWDVWRPKDVDKIKEDLK